MEPGNYIVKETNRCEYPLNISGYDTDRDCDNDDKDTMVRNIIGVLLLHPAKYVSNDFVDINKGSIGRSVTDEAGEPWHGDW